MSKNLKLGEDICQPVCQTDGPQFLSADPPLRIKADDAPKCFLKVSFPFFFFFGQVFGIIAWTEKWSTLSKGLASEISSIRLAQVSIVCERWLMVL